MNAAAKFLADDGMRTLPIACRLVPLDQWLVTHVDTSWKVKDIKQWVLSKCNIWGSAGAPQPPRFRPPSPVTFSSFSRRSSLDSVSWAGTEEGGEDDWDAFAAVDYNAELRASDAALVSSSTKTPLESEAPDFYISPQPQPRSSTEREFDATSAQFTLVSFSNGFILEDDAYLSWYKPRPFELFEVHRAGAIVSLPRGGISYAEPYFESAVRVSERPHNKRSARTSEDQQAHSIEWKLRWVIIRDGVLHLCKEAHLHPTHRFPLSALCALYGPEQFGLGINDRNASSQIICAKFDRMSMSGSIISRELDDVNSPPYQDRKKPKTTSWVLLDMPSRSSYENLLRILHRLAPHPLSSSFIPSRAPAVFPNSPTSPRHRSRSSVILPSPIDSERSYDSSASTFFGVQYPEWRLALLQRCRMAGRGAIGSALSLAQAHCLIATSGTCEFYHLPLPRASSISEGLRRRAGQVSTSGASEDEDVSKRPDASGVHPWKEALSEGGDEDEEDDDAESEIEWEGWFRDLARRPTRPPLFSTHENRSRAVSASPSSSEADYDYMEVGAPARVRTLSTAPNPSKPTSPQRSRSSTISTAGTVFGSTYTTTTTITTYVDRVPDLRAPSASPSPPTWTQQSFAGTMPMPPSPSSSSPRNTSRARLVRAAAGSPVTGVPMRMTPPQSMSGSASRVPSVSGSEMSGSIGDGSGGSGRNSGIGGVKRIVRGVSIRNAFSAERFVRGFENALDFVDGR